MALFISRSILNIFAAWLLYSAEGFRYYRVPVADGVTLTSEAVVATCKEHGMMPTCFCQAQPKPQLNKVGLS